ncbi:MAG: NYN domain-containing protein [Verrucomicrobiota bacterium]|jgi:1-aminocyclopropane-1-carboxylate deaminase/D-cysteine desulfhydrase-like pyridoxal-dependent ACC family enzyme
MNTTRFFEFSPSGRNRCRHVADKPFHVLLPNQRLHCPSGRMLSKALPTITDLAPLRGARVALVADDDNIRISTQRHRRRFSYRTLLERMGKEARVVAALAVVTAVPGDQGRQHYLETRGWRTLVLPREMCAGVNGLRLRSNADLDLCLEVGCWLAAVSFDVLAVVSGDGDLCVSIARAAARHRPDVRVVTLAIPSSASQQLRTRRDLFHAHVALGRDLTRPFDREL